MGDRPIGYALTGLAVLAAAGSAQATVQTKTVAGTALGAVALSRFDPSLGTLMQVTAAVSYQASTGYYNFTPPTGFDHAVTGTASLGNLLFDLSGNTLTTDLGSGRGYFTVNAAGSATWSSATALAGLTGGSSLFGSALVFAPAPGSTTVSAAPTVNYKLTYTYDDAVSGAVPEPATWAMMAGGFALVGVALRGARRRRSAAGAIMSSSRP